MNCPICRHEIPDEALLCPVCGNQPALYLQQQVVDAARADTRSAVFDTFRTPFAAVYTSVMSVICLAGLVAAILSLAQGGYLRFLLCALFSVFSGISAFGGWCCFFSHTDNLSAFRKLYLLPNAAKHILRVPQVLLCIAAALGLTVVILLTVGVGAAGQALVDWLSQFNIDFLTTTGKAISSLVSGSLIVICAVLAALCLLLLFLLGELAGSFNKIRKQYRALRSFAAGKTDTAPKPMKAVFVYVWGGLIAAVSLLTMRGQASDVCFNLLCAFLGLYAILSGVMLDLVRRRTEAAQQKLTMAEGALAYVAERTAAAEAAARRENGPSAEAPGEADGEKADGEADGEKADGEAAAKAGEI